MTLGRRLAFYRKKQALTQGQLGEKLNISAQAISKWENDQAEPDVATLIQLSKILGVTFDELLTGTESAPPRSDPPSTTVVNVLVPPKVEKASKSKPVWKAITSFVSAHRYLLIALISVLLIFCVSAAILLPQCLPMIKFSRIELGMDIEKVEQMLGEPHEYILQKSIGNQSFEDDGSYGSAFVEGFMSGFYDKDVVVTGGTYFYYFGEYGRAFEKYNKLQEELEKTDKLSQADQLLQKVEEQEKEMEKLAPGSFLKVVYKNGKVTLVHLETTLFGEEYIETKR